MRSKYCLFWLSLLCYSIDALAKRPPLRSYSSVHADGLFDAKDASSTAYYNFSLSYEWGSPTHYSEPSLKRLCMAHSNAKKSPLNMILIRGLTAFASDADPKEPVLSLSYHCATPFPQRRPQDADSIIGHQSTLYNCSHMADDVAFCQSQHILLFLVVEARDAAKMLATTAGGMRAAEMIFDTFFKPSGKPVRRPFGSTVELDGIHCDLDATGPGYIVFIQRLKELMNNGQSQLKSYYLSTTLRSSFPDSFYSLDSFSSSLLLSSSSSSSPASSSSPFDLVIVKDAYRSQLSKSQLEAWLQLAMKTTSSNMEAPGIIFTEPYRDLTPLEDLYKPMPPVSLVDAAASTDARCLPKKQALLYGLYYADPAFDAACQASDSMVHTHGTSFIAILSQPCDASASGSLRHIQCIKSDSVLDPSTLDGIANIDGVFGDFEPLVVPHKDPTSSDHPGDGTSQGASMTSDSPSTKCHGPRLASMHEGIQTLWAAAFALLACSFVM